MVRLTRPSPLIFSFQSFLPQVADAQKLYLSGITFKTSIHTQWEVQF